MTPDSVFRVRAHRPEFSNGQSWPQILPGTYLEPVEASDAAENWLKLNGKDGQSFCDLLFNGDAEPHTSVFRIAWNRFGIWNREYVPWPIDYIDPQTGEPAKLFEHPHFFAEGEDDLPPTKEEADDGEHKKADESDSMKLDGEDDESDSESDSDDDGDSDDEDDDDSENGAGDDSDGDEEADDGDEESEDDEEGDSEDDESENESDPDDEQEKPEMPRLNIFAKMRGPKGWRKRAEIEELNEKNVFGLKIGIVDEEGETPGTQEYNVRAEVQFIENDATRTHGIMKLKVPEGVLFEQKGNWWVAEIPYYDDED